MRFLLRHVSNGKFIEGGGRLFSDPLAEGRGQVKNLTFNLTNMRSTFNFKIRNSIWPWAYGPGHMANY